MILDIHTHHPAPQPLAVIDASPRSEGVAVEIADGQLYSAGIHPYDTISEIPDEMWQRLEELLRLPQVVAVGECGVDLSGRGGMMYRQLQIFRRQIEMSEALKKPMIVHCVKADDVICGLRRDLKPTQPWVIHGFRRKPGSASQLLRAGCYLSYGAIFNEASLAETPPERILAETDESDKPIEKVILDLSIACGRNLREIIAENSALFLHLPPQTPTSSELIEQ